MGARSILLAALSLAAARGFQALRGASTRTLLRAATVEAAPAATGERLSAERYVVQNRFRVKKGREPAFEKRWADRESRLGTLPGFRFFCMLRRVDDASAEDDVNYVSNTVWETQENFEAWRKGDAFKEAHGGGTIGGIASMLLATARNTKGKPKLASWEGLLPQSTTPSTPPAAWKQVEADGVTQLDGEAFVGPQVVAFGEVGVLSAVKGAAPTPRVPATGSSAGGLSGIKGPLSLASRPGVSTGGSALRPEPSGSRAARARPSTTSPSPSWSTASSPPIRAARITRRREPRSTTPPRPSQSAQRSARRSGRPSSPSRSSSTGGSRGIGRTVSGGTK